MPDLQFANPPGWYALASILALVLLYLMRPKPQEKSIPSLMFFMLEKGFNKKTAFFRKFFNSLLFFIQLLALALLSVSATLPFTTLIGEQAIEKTIIVLDTSASMQTGSRMSQATEAARSRLHGTVTVILAQNTPLLVLEDGTTEEAEKVLTAATPSDTATNIGDAMLLAGDLVKDKLGKVYVISDFINTEGPDLIASKRILASKGVSSEFISVSGHAANAGITDLVLGKTTTKAIVKNYNPKDITATLSIIGEEGTKHIQKTVLPKSIETYEFDTPSGYTEIRLQEKDDFDVDNHAYISAPGLKRIKVLLVTNSDRSYLKTALQASKDIQLSIAEPPVIPNLEYDVIIMHSFSPNLVLPDFYQEALRKTKNGTSIIITAQEGIGTLPADIMPVHVREPRNNTKITTTITNRFTTDVDFGTAFRYYNATPKKGTAVIAEAGTAAMLALRDEGRGKIIYSGIIDDYSDFKTTVYYPIFWSKLINFLTETDDLNDYNYRTGKIYADQTGIKQYMDKAGFYASGNKKVAASLLNEKESDVAKTDMPLLNEEKLISARQGTEKRDMKFEQYMIAAGIAILLAELLYIKRRGDL
ncbi:BatA domain-containing protein [Candidatus Woesearchaeota archaeon]|nr:BatA domain-containing protein [Candidatus Woesearchaeota archaeon]